MRADYDDRGTGYGRTRRPDPRIAAAIRSALREAASFVNVGAGTGSYEPDDRSVVAVEPSMTMIRQRGAAAAPCILGRAECLPFPDRSFDAAAAILTIHHWGDRSRGLRELRRVSRDRVVLLTWDPEVGGFWLTREYCPEFLETDRRRFPGMAEIREALGPIESVPVPIPHDCVDGFLGAFWRRPEAYLDPAIRNGISSFAAGGFEPGLRRLEVDLASGRWRDRNAAILDAAELDLGYRLVIAGA